eukprot:365717-Chlamydomonas_euryale.AAC.12
MASEGRTISVAAASRGNAASANVPKQNGEGRGLLWRCDPAFSTSIPCQAGQRGWSTPMESPPEPGGPFHKARDAKRSAWGLHTLTSSRVAESEADSAAASDSESGVAEGSPNPGEIALSH